MSTASTTPATLNELLHLILTKPRSHRWVCDFLFDSLTKSVIRRETVLPPSIFATSVQLSIRMNKPTADAGNLCYVPVHYSSHIIAGYCFFFSEIHPHHFVDDDDFPFKAPFIARFVYDVTDGQFVYTIHGTSRKYVGVSGGLLRQDGYAHYTFAVPSKEYGWNHLPTEPIIVLQSTECEVDEWNGTQAVNHMKQLLRERTISWNDGYIPIEMLTGNGLESCLASLERAMISRPFGFERRIDRKQCDNNKFATDVFFQLSRADEMMKTILRKNCSSVYYELVLTASVDHRYLKMIAPRPRNGEEMMIPQQQWKEKGNACLCGYENCPCVIKARKEREKILEQRRIRNRLSAARSNQKRKEKWAKMGIEVEELKGRCLLLKQKEEDLKKKNQRLRLLLQASG